MFLTDVHHIQGENQLVREVSRCQLSFAPELALALSVKKYSFPNDYTRYMKVNTAFELLVQEAYQLCSEMHSSVTAVQLQAWLGQNHMLTLLLTDQQVFSLITSPWT